MAHVLKHDLNNKVKYVTKLNIVRGEEVFSNTFSC